MWYINSTDLDIIVNIDVNISSNIQLLYSLQYFDNVEPLGLNPEQ